GFRRCEVRHGATGSRVENGVRGALKFPLSIARRDRDVVNWRRMVSKAGAASLAPHGAEEKRLARVRAIAELRHPHLIVMRELEEGGYVAEIGSGLTLSELQEARGPLPLRVSLRILLDAMSGLSALHRARVGPKSLDFVHGEVTPDNIVV